MIHHGDCLEVMAGMPDASVDAIVTDPPAGIAFMSKHWDRDKGGRTEWVAWMTDVMRECYRVLKPGGYAVVWSIPRTCHWTAWAMEDAGFIIRDQLAHIYASGFPKGKAQLKPAREDWWLARKPGPLRHLNIDECRIPSGGEQSGWSESGSKAGPNLSMSGANYARDPKPDDPAGRWPSNVLLSDPELFDEPNRWVVGSGATASVNPAGVFGRDEVASRSLDFGYAERDVFGYGDSGGYSRFFAIPRRPEWNATSESSNTRHVAADAEDAEPATRGLDTAPAAPVMETSSPESSDYPTAYLIPKADRADREPVLRGQLAEQDVSERNQYAGLPDRRMDHVQNRTARVNHHPTVKSTDLMAHLIKLVTPPGGVVLDPFLGSGSTAVAAERLGVKWIGIEKEAEYVAIAEARLNGVQRGLGLDVPAPTKAPPKTHPDLSKHQPKRRAPAENWTGGWTGTDEEPAA